MRPTQAAVVALVLTLSAAPDLGARCDTGNTPGATLLFPYFEVDLDVVEGRSTLVAIHNAASEPVLAHAVLWTNRGVPTFTFDLFLKARGVVTLNLRDVIKGAVPETGTAPGFSPLPGISEFPSCSDPISLVELDETGRAELEARHTGQPSPIDGLCYSSPSEPRLATGYLTVDAMNDCSSTIRLPGDEGYFAEGGTGLASNRNVLSGDFFLVDPANDSAQGLEAVALVADAERFGALFPYTFYRRFTNGLDARASLINRMRVRYLLGGAFDAGTDLVVWTEGKGLTAGGPQPCDSRPDQEDIWLFATFRDHGGDVVAPIRLSLDRNTQRLKIGSDDLPVPTGFGTLETKLNLFCPGITPPWCPLQSWAMTLVQAEGRFSVGLQAACITDPRL